MALRLLAFALSVAPAAVAINVANPAQEQLAPVLRPGAQFEWTLSSDTFLPQPASLAADNLPAWLAFDGPSLTFSGTPPADMHFTGPLEPVELLAIAPDGQSVSDQVVFYMSTKSAPVVLHSIASQLLPNASPLSSVFLLRPGSALAQNANENDLRVPPGWSFSIGWRHDTFVFPPPHDNDDVQYTAKLSNGLPLPGWLVYNTTSLTFSGVAPKLAVPSRFAITLYGGDAPGYRAIDDSFVLTIAAHEVSLAQATIDALLVPINGSANSPVVANLPILDLLLDGKPLTTLEAQDVTVSFESDPIIDWLTIDASSLALNGTPPLDYVGQSSIPLLITLPTISQTVRTHFSLAIVPSVFTVPRVPSIWVKPGKTLSFNLGEYINPSVGPAIHDDALVMRTDSSDHAGWLRFDSGTRILEGKAPSVASRLEATFMATDPVVHSVAQTLLVIFVSEEKPGDADAAGVDPFDRGDKENSTDKPKPTSSSEKKSNNVSRSVVALVVGALLAFVLLCMLAACCRRFCTARDDLESNTSNNAIHHIDFDAVRRASREADRAKSGNVGRNESAGWGVASLFGNGGTRKAEREKEPGIAVVVRTLARKEIDCDGTFESHAGGYDEGWTCVPRDAGLTDDEKRARGYPVGIASEQARRKASLIARVLDRPWYEGSAQSVQHKRMVALSGDSPEVCGASHTVDSFRALNRQARDGSVASVISGSFDGHEQPSRIAGLLEGSNPSLGRQHAFDLDPHELVSSGSGSSGSSSGLVGSPASMPRQRIRSPLSHSQPYAHSDLRTSPPDSFDSFSTTQGTGLAMNKPAEERRMFCAPTHSNGSIRTADVGPDMYTSGSFGDLYDEDVLPASGSEGSTGALSGSADVSESGTSVPSRDLRASLDESPSQGALSRGGGQLRVPCAEETGALQTPSPVLSAATPVLGTRPAYNVRTHEDVRLVETVSRSASADTAPRIPPIARHRQSMSLGYGKDVRISVDSAVLKQPLQLDKPRSDVAALLPAHQTYSDKLNAGSSQVDTAAKLARTYLDDRGALNVPSVRPGQRGSALSYLTTSSANDEEEEEEEDDDPDLERTEAARMALVMGRGGGGRGTTTGM